MNYFRKPLYLLLLISIFTGMLSLQPSEPVRAASTENAVRISQAYGGGGSDNDSPYKNDFIELYNASDFPVNLDGWRVQYATSTGTTWQYGADLKGEIPAHGYYLIQGNSAGTKGASLPTPDVDANDYLPMASAGFKIALTKTRDLLSGKCPTDSNIVDFLGVGGANCKEGSGTAPEIKTRTASIRKENGCQDTNDNAADFEAEKPNPRNTASPRHYCNIAPTVSGVTAIGAEGFEDVDAVDMTITIDKGYKVSTLEITMNEPVVVALGTLVTINPQAADYETVTAADYGTVTAVNETVITVTPTVDNETASLVGTSTLTLPTGSVEDLAGGAWLNAPITLVVQDVTNPTIVSGKAIGATGFDDVTMSGTTFNVPQGYTVDHIEFTMSEPVTIVAPGIVYIGGNPYGTMSASGSVVTLTPYSENEFLKIPGKTTLTIDAGSIVDLSDNPIEIYRFDFDVAPSPIFNITDFGPWGATWPGAYNLGWAYVPLFDTTTIAKIEVGMLDSNGKIIVKYTAEGEQIVWQRNNGYITTEKLSSAPFYRVYNGNPLAEGIDDDWTVTFGPSFDAWSPRYGYVAVTDIYGTFVSKEIQYTGDLGDLTAPEIDEAVAVGVYPFGDVTADNLSFTVPQGYTVEKIEFTMSEPVTVVVGTEVTLAGERYGSITADGTLITVTPYEGNKVANLLGTFVFKVPNGKIFDISGNRLGTLEATMIVTNVPPVAEDDAYTTDEDETLIVGTPGVLSNDTDYDVSVLTAVLKDGPSNGNLSLNANGGFTYTPDAKFTGTDSFTYKAFDGVAYSDVAEVSITVTAVNVAPVAQDQTVTTPEDTAIEIILGATDADLDTLTYNIVEGLSEGPYNGSLGVVSGNKVIYTPTLNYFGTDSFTFKANDGTVDSIAATVSITVTAVNDAPVLIRIPDATIPEMVAYTFTATATDVDSANLTFSMNGGPAGATIDAKTGIFSWTPSEAQGYGVYKFTVKVCDNGSPALCAEQEVTLTVEEVNIAPVAFDQTVLSLGGEMIEIELEASDADGNILEFFLIEKPLHGSFELVSNILKYAPSANFGGVDKFTFIANDGILDSNIATVTINVSQTLYPIFLPLIHR